MENFYFSNIKAIIGLGNPGQQYTRNRHNIGFRIIDDLVSISGISWNITDEHENVSVQLLVRDHLQFVTIIKPLTYMNNSGRIALFLQKKGIKSNEILVVSDELEKKFGVVQICFGGSARGHNGIKSLIGAIGEGFWRLRFGIGRPENKTDVPNYVLSNFTNEEEQQLPALIRAIFHKNLEICIAT
jgi:PTH1 family peptidyl-tRNA hydrolase